MNSKSVVGATVGPIDKFAAAVVVVVAVVLAAVAVVGVIGAVVVKE